MTDHSFATRTRIEPNNLGALDFDILISSFNSSERVQRVFNESTASRKIWLVHPEYEYTSTELPTTGEIWQAPSASEAVVWRALFEDLGLAASLPGARLAVDITGMTRPCIMLLPLMFRRFNVDRVTILYSDPLAYVKGAGTAFSTGAIDRVSQIGGLEGSHSTRYDDKDVLVIGAGYDVDLMKTVAESKRSARHYLLVGLPALQSHMYQEARLQIGRVQESVNRFSSSSLRFAPANDPFVTASTLQTLVREVRIAEPAANVYLSPVGPKPHVLGFAWYMLCEPNLQGVSAIFPYALTYSKETSLGIARVHRFELELDWIVASA